MLKLKALYNFRNIFFSVSSYEFESKTAAGEINPLNSSFYMPEKGSSPLKEDAQVLTKGFKQLIGKMLFPSFLCVV